MPIHFEIHPAAATDRPHCPGCERNSPGNSPGSETRITRFFNRKITSVRAVRAKIQTIAYTHAHRRLIGKLGGQGGQPGQSTGHEFGSTIRGPR